MVRHLLRAGLQSGSIMSMADIVTQFGIEGKEIQSSSYDGNRTLRWALAGMFLHGPYFYVGFSRLDQYFGPAKTISIVLRKTMSAQFILFPPYLVGLFSFLGVLEGCDNIPNKLTQRVPEAFLNGCIFWPVSNSINFSVISSYWRIPYLSLSAGIWNSYLSWANAK